MEIMFEVEEEEEGEAETAAKKKAEKKWFHFLHVKSSSRLDNIYWPHIDANSPVVTGLVPYVVAVSGYFAPDCCR